MKYACAFRWKERCASDDVDEMILLMYNTHSTHALTHIAHMLPTSYSTHAAHNHTRVAHMVYNSTQAAHIFTHMLHTYSHTQCSVPAGVL